MSQERETRGESFDGAQRGHPQARDAASNAKATSDEPTWIECPVGESVDRVPKWRKSGLGDQTSKLYPTMIVEMASLVICRLLLRFADFTHCFLSASVSRPRAHHPEH